MSRRRRIPPQEVEITHLGKGGTGIGMASDGRPIQVRKAPPGARVLVRPTGRSKAGWTGARTALVRPPPASNPPPCPVFDLCGGCALQDLTFEAQLQAKHELALRQIQQAWAEHTDASLPTVPVHAPRYGGQPWGYRNKVELGFGPSRYLSEADHAAGLPIDGRFLGFHAAGRFDRVIDVERCPLISDAANQLLSVVRHHALQDAAPPPYNVRTHEGFWRHLVLREGHNTGELLLCLVTATPGEPETAAVRALAEALMATDLASKRLCGVVWMVSTSLADVARGEVCEVWGEPHFYDALGEVRFRISPTSFFQTNTAGAECLYDTVGEALGHGGHLLDLYCGAGAIGLYLHGRVGQITGIDEVEAAVQDARRNAAEAGITNARYLAAKVEDALHELEQVSGPRRIVVDPPRPGLHPKVTRALAKAQADALVYVACNPASLGRDAAVLTEGGWQLQALWTVDLFPWTGHIEAVARFIRPASAAA